MRFIHISDLHFNPNIEGRTSRKIRAGLISYLQELNAYADELIITGDFRHARYQGSNQNDIDKIVQYIKNIAQAVGITDVKHIHLVPGNHDRDRKKGEGKIMAGIRKKYNPAEGFFEESDLDFLLQKFEYFRKISDFIKKTKTKHAIHSTLITTYGVVDNAYRNELQAIITGEEPVCITCYRLEFPGVLLY